MHRGLGGMVRKFKLVVWTLALVGLWASTEQGAFTTPPGPAEPEVMPRHPAIPDGTWAKLKTMFSEAAAETPAVESRKGKQ